VPLLEQVLNKYPEDVKLVFKNFPLGNHKNAIPAAKAAHAAEKQDKFWEFHDLLFQNYNRLNPTKMQEIAKQLELDLVKYQKDLENQKTKDLIRKDQSEGYRIGVTGTPAVYVNGKRLRSRNLSGFQRVIEKELNKNK
jgi:protein-disulfide isomerase